MDRVSATRRLTAVAVVLVSLAALLSGGCDENDGDLKTVDPDGSPDLTLTKTVDLNGNRTPHETAVIRYQIDLRNEGSWDALGVTVRDSLPAQVTYVDADADKGEYDPETHLWTVGLVPADTVFTLALTVSVNAATMGQVVSNTARVVAMSPPDDDVADNVSTALFAVLNDPPRAMDDAYACAEGGTLQVAEPGILDNDTDIENEPFDLVLDPVNAPWHGSVDLAPDGGFEYIHDGSEAATDSFTYVIQDAGAAADTGMVRLTIDPVNDAPVAVDNFYQVAEGGTVGGNVLDNDFDPEEDAFSAVLAQEPAHAANFTLDGDGLFTYTHDGSEILQDQFIYQADDGADLSAPAVVTIGISSSNDPPVVLGIPDQEIAEGESFAVVMLDGYVTDSDHDDDELVWSHSGEFELGVTIDPVTHYLTVTTPNPDWSGNEILTFRATDPNGAWDEDEAIFEVRPVNDPPRIATIQPQTVPEGGEFDVLVLDDYVTDVDNDDDELEWVATGGEPFTVDIDADRRLTVIVPGENWFGQATVNLTVEDPGGLDDQRNVQFTVTPVNDPPVTTALPDQSAEPGGSFLAIGLDAFVSDVDDDDEDMIWTYRDNGELLVSISNDRVATVEVPNGSWMGVVTIIFRATDPSGGFDETEATFTVSDSLPTE